MTEDDLRTMLISVFFAASPPPPSSPSVSLPSPSLAAAASSPSQLFETSVDTPIPAKVHRRFSTPPSNIAISPLEVGAQQSAPPLRLSIFNPGEAVANQVNLLVVDAFRDVKQISAPQSEDDHGLLVPCVHS